MEGSVFFLLSPVGDLHGYGCIGEREDGMCETHGGEGKPRAAQAGNPMSSFISTGPSCAGNRELPRKLLLKPCAGEEGWAVHGLPPSRTRCVLGVMPVDGRSWGLRRCSRPAARVCLPCLRQPLRAGSTMLAFTRRQTGGLDALPAFCYQGHRLGSVPSSFSLRWSGILPRIGHSA